MNRIATTLALLAAPLAAQAEELTFSGDIRLQHTEFDGVSESFLIGSGDLSYDFGNSFGIVSSLDTYIFEGDELTALYIAGEYAGAFGSLQFGAPESAVDSYASPGEFNRGGLAPIALQTFQMRRSLVHTYALFDDEIPWGLRFDSMSGDLSYGASLHSLEDGDIHVLGGAFRYDAAPYAFTGGLEYAEAPGESRTTLRLGLEADHGAFTGSAYIYAGTDGFPTILELNGNYSVSDKVELGAAAMLIEDEINIFGVNAHYNFTENVYARASLSDADGGFPGPALDVSVGFRF